MKVFLVFPMADGQTGPAIKHAFEQLGHEIISVDARLQTNKIYETYQEFKSDLVFCTKTPEVTNQIRNIKQKFNPIICMWNPDARKSIDNWASLFPLIKLVDFHFVVDINLIDDWKKLNPNTFWLPQGLQDEIYNRPKIITKIDIKKYSCDVSFCGDRIGSYHKFRDKYLIPIENMKINFKHWTGIYNEEHNKMVSLSKINLGCSGSNNAKIRTSVSVRDYKIIGAGGFLLTDSGGGLDKIFPCEGHKKILDYYNSPNDLIKKIKFWLPKNEERKKIAERGYEWIHKNATYVHRIKSALDYMGI